MRDHLRSQRVWLRLGALVTTFIAMGFDINPALFGEHAFAVGPIAYAVVFVIITTWVNERGYRRLVPAEQRTCREVQRTGLPSGDQHIDAVAHDRLTRRARADTRGNRLFLIALLVVMIGGLPILAALRTHDAWYLLCAAPAIWLAVLRPRRKNPVPAKDRLQALTNAVSG